MRSQLLGAERSHRVNRDQVLRRMAPLESAIPGLWPMVLEVVDSFCSSGVIRAAVDP